MTDQALILDNLRTTWASLDDLFAGLSDEQWQTQSYCPEWDTRGVAIHLLSVETVLEGWRPDGLETPPPFEKMGDAVAAVKHLSGPEVHAALGAIMEVRLAELGAMSQADFDAESLTPAGPATYGRFMAIRVFDFWLHERDVRGPLGIAAATDGGAAAEMALDEVHGSLGYIVGKNLGLPDGKSIVFRLTGPVERDLCAVVDGRAQVVDSVDDPDVVVTTDSTTFMLLAGGRIDAEGAIADGAITWAGDDEWGAKAARSLRYTR